MYSSIYGVFEHTAAKHTYLYTYLYGQGKFFGFKVTLASKKICITVIIQNNSI